MLYYFKEGANPTAEERTMLNKLNHLNIFQMNLNELEKLFDYFGDRITCINVLV